MSTKVFISYRRDDSNHVAGRLRDSLATTYGRDNVFFDVDSIKYGHDFRDIVKTTLSDVDVVLVVIGHDWRPERLASANDNVRLEIMEALAQEKLIVPVLLDGKTMPGPGELPADLEKLPYLNAAQLRRDPDFHSDIQRLVESLPRRASPAQKDGRGSHESSNKSLSRQNTEREAQQATVRQARVKAKRDYAKAVGWLGITIPLGIISMMSDMPQIVQLVVAILILFAFFFVARGLLRVPWSRYLSE